MMDNYRDFLALGALIISIIVALYNGYSSNRLKKLENKLEIQKNKSLLNDKRNREIFENFIQMYIDLLFSKKDKSKKTKKELINEKENMEKVMLNVKKTLMINGSGKVVNEFNNFTLLSKEKKRNNKKMFESFDNLIRYWREEIGVNNDKLEKFGLFQILLNDDVNDIELLKK